MRCSGAAVVNEHVYLKVHYELIFSLSACCHSNVPEKKKKKERRRSSEATQMWLHLVANSKSVFFVQSGIYEGHLVLHPEENM